MRIEKLQTNSCKIYLDKSVYSLNTIFKCFYWYKSNYEIDIDAKGEYHEVHISTLQNELALDELIPKIKADLIDFKTREIIHNETKNIRELLVAKAFAQGEEYDQPPPGGLDDPVGFRPDDF
jgi:His-Xaa-Ser system protein HxsD